MSESSQDSGENRTITESGLEDLLAEYTDTSSVFEATPEISVNVLFRELSHPGRRYVLTYLLLRDEFVSLSEMVDYVTDVSQRRDPSGAFREEVVAELVETHLPRLQDAGLVDYRVERQFIGPTETTPAALPYLSLALNQVNASKAEQE